MGFVFDFSENSFARPFKFNTDDYDIQIYDIINLQMDYYQSNDIIEDDKSIYFRERTKIKKLNNYFKEVEVEVNIQRMFYRDFFEE